MSGRAAFHSILKKLVKLPLIRALFSLYRRISEVMEAPGGMSFRPMPEAGAAAKPCRELTIISTNLWHDWPQHRRALERLEAFAQLVLEHRADVLLLQEVARTRDIWADHWLADRLGMGYVYSRSNGHVRGIGFEEGLAIFSRHPIDQPILRQLSPGSNRFVHRMALGGQIAAPCGPLMAFSVHLGLLGKQNAAQVAHLGAWVHGLSQGLPALIGGDFNAGEGSRQIKSLQQKWTDTFRQINPLADGTTHEVHGLWGPPLHRARLDYIFLKSGLKPWKILSASHLETPGERHSDHRAVLLRLSPAHLPASL